MSDERARIINTNARRQTLAAYSVVRYSNYTCVIYEIIVIGQSELITYYRDYIFLLLKMLQYTILYYNLHSKKRRHNIM